MLQKIKEIQHNWQMQKLELLVRKNGQVTPIFYPEGVKDGRKRPTRPTGSTGSGPDYTVKIRGKTFISGS